MFTFENPLTKAIFYAKAKSHGCLDMISRWTSTLISPEIQEEDDGRSARLFCLLNLIFLVSLILLSPDKLAQMLPFTRPSWLGFDWIQDVVEALGKMAPF